MNEEKLKRPDGLTVLSILMFLSALLNVSMGSTTITGSTSTLIFLSEYMLDSWFSFAIPVEIILTVIMMVLSILQIITAAGLWTGKKYSYNLALGIPIAFVIVNLLFFGLYATAPSSIELNITPTISLVPVVISLVWVFIYWGYLRKPHVKAFL